MFFNQILQFLLNGFFSYVSFFAFVFVYKKFKNKKRKRKLKKRKEKKPQYARDVM